MHYCLCVQSVLARNLHPCPEPESLRHLEALTLTSSETGTSSAAGSSTGTIMWMAVLIAKSSLVEVSGLASMACSSTGPEETRRRRRGTARQCA